jgi:hypothetical protein
MGHYDVWAMVSILGCGCEGIGAYWLETTVHWLKGDYCGYSVKWNLPALCRTLNKKVALQNNMLRLGGNAFTSQY